MLTKRCGFPSGVQRVCLMPGNFSSNPSKSSAKFFAADSTASTPPVNLRKGGGIRMVMGNGFLLSPISKFDFFSHSGCREMQILFLKINKLGPDDGGLFETTAHRANCFQAIAGDGEHG